LEEQRFVGLVDKLVNRVSPIAELNFA
jgi:hypothetical protein